jgi:hypothetical protein
MASDLEITLERRGDTLRVRAYLNQRGFVACACRHDYPADTVTEDEVLNDIAKELDVDVARVAHPKPLTPSELPR